MIVDFHDDCWLTNDNDWKEHLGEILILLKRQSQHAVVADSKLMLAWCRTNIALFEDYYRTRLASSNMRANALEIEIRPDGADFVETPPPWKLSAKGAFSILKEPLRMVMENNSSDRMFVEAVFPSFKEWIKRDWLTAAMGGGSAMAGDMRNVSSDAIARWRTFYLFDSDRLHPEELQSGWTPPGGDGCQGYIFERASLALPPARSHRLNRRSIENYLPQVVLQALNEEVTTTLFDSAVGSMANFYNIKAGLAGDGVYPENPGKLQRSRRCKGFWIGLPEESVKSLQAGYGDKVAENFNAVPSNHSWPTDICEEIDILAVALQDAL